MFNVTQMQMTDMSDYTVERLYEHTQEKQHLTVLMRGKSADDSIRRFNVAVRLFAADSEFVKDLLPKIHQEKTCVLITPYWFSDHTKTWYDHTKMV